MTHRKTLILAAIAASLVVCASSARAQAIDWEAWGRGSAVNVAQALPAQTTDCEGELALSLREEAVATAMGFWSLGVASGLFHKGLYEGYVAELQRSYTVCDYLLGGATIGRAAGAVGVAFWRGVGQHLVPGERERLAVVIFSLVPPLGEPQIDDCRNAVEA